MINHNKYVDFSDTQTAFASKSDKELRKALWLFKLMHRTWLVDVATVVGGFAIRWHLPFAKMIAKKTVFEQFVGGESLAESQESIEKLGRSRILTVLDYGAEGKSSERELDAARDQFMNAITFAASSESVPVISIKVSALAENQLLEAVQAGKALTEVEKNRFKAVKQRIDKITHQAHQHGVKIFVDAEESWIQDPID